MNKYPIYIISKGRHKNLLTRRELLWMGVKHSVVVEECDASNYKDCGEDLIVMPFSNLGQGSIPARNFVWEHALKQGHKRHWVLDDNIEGFHRLHMNKKWKVKSPVIFRFAEDFVDRYENIGLSGFNYYSFCKSTDAVPPFYLNTRIYSCILVDNYLPFRWRGRYNEDTDLSIRVLKSGLCTVLFNAFLCGKVTTMRMGGGNTDELYAGEGRKNMAESLVEQHPDIARVSWKFGRWQHHVNYKGFRTKLIKAQKHNSGICVNLRLCENCS